ncbi:MAG: sulfite exporter TauE/SafE family protein, partial [Actinobacteria bacterium]|nr:sulfite exporter TauE/SafE family protein [Actinomycetota bacterium]
MDLMTVGETLAVLGAVLVASTTQVTVGFGFALLAVPLMSLAVPTHDAVIISTILGLLTSSFQAHHGRRDTDRTLVRRLILSSCVGIPMGLLLFQRVDERVLRGVLGASVLGAVVFLMSRRPVRSSVGLDWVCGVLSGALASSLSTNGPPLVFVLQARELPMSVFRPTINTVFTAINNGGNNGNGTATSDGSNNLYAIGFPPGAVAGAPFANALEFATLRLGNGNDFFAVTGQGIAQS